MTNLLAVPFPKRFADKVDFGGECWVWTACKNNKGYGHYQLGGKAVLAHRVAWEYFFGEIPDGLCVLHKCDNPPCVNPEHHFLGTLRDNAVDRSSKGRGNRPIGRKNGMAVLTQVEVEEIRKTYKRYSRGEFTAPALAKKYGVCQQQISNIVNQKNWI